MERIELALQNALQPSLLNLTDDSAKHKGHAGAADGRGHFSLEIESTAFVGKSLIQQHRMVYQCVDALMQTDIHALSLKTRAPS
jgi:BolA family transcriptional regulator, general stress-responsive regulator